jgi:alkylhydroperoxidase family enzyme
MSRIPPIENMPFPFPEDLGMAASSITNMSTLFRVMAHRPELAQQSMQVLETAMRTGSVDPKLKELLAIRVSQVNHCHY